MSTWDDKPNDYEHALAQIELARRMRAAQIKYFKTRDRSDLVAAKQLEKEFDESAS